MKRRLSILTVTALMVVALVSGSLTVPSPALAGGAMQIDGIAFPSDLVECTDSEGQDADFAIRMTGDLEGCHYVFVETAVCTPSGVYKETGTEVFVGMRTGPGGGAGTFKTTYSFTAKYKDCANLLEEIHGRCQHPLVAGSGEGYFDGVRGRLDFKDDVENFIFPYRGHLQW